jgi:hypothetical protein
LVNTANSTSAMTDTSRMFLVVSFKFQTPLSSRYTNRRPLASKQIPAPRAR